MSPTKTNIALCAAGGCVVFGGTALGLMLFKNSVEEPLQTAGTLGEGSQALSHTVDGSSGEKFENETTSEKDTGSTQGTSKETDQKDSSTNTKMIYVKKAPGHDVLLRDDDESFFVTSNSAPSFEADGKFNLRPSVCSRIFFPHAWMPDLESFEEKVTEDDRFDTGVLTPKRKNIHYQNKARGCAAMGVKRKGHLFLFKSEITLHNDRIGLIYWTGIKNVSGTRRADLLNLQLQHYLVLLERTRDGGDWSIRGGYGWGTEDEPEVANIKKLSIKFPNGRSEDILHQNAISDTPTINGYVGMWKEDSSSNGVPALRIASTPYHVNTNWKWYVDYQNLELDPTIINGYNMNGRNIKTFFYEPIQGPGN